MFELNQNLRGTNEVVNYSQWHIEEMIKCSQDILYFVEKYCYIQTIDHGFIIPKLELYQKKMLKAYVQTPEDRRHIISMCPRQARKTSTTALYLLWYAIFNKEENIAILGNKQSIAIEILSKIRESYERLPLWMQPGLKADGWNKKELKLSNGMRIMAAASSSSALRGFTFSIIYLDEFAFLQKHIAEEFMRSMFPTITAGEKSKILISSTPCGLNHFYDLWQGAIRELEPNNFYPIRVYESEVPRTEGHEKFKKSIINRDGILTWNQEYECVTFDTKITIRDKDTLEIITINISDLINLLLI